MDDVIISIIVPIYNGEKYIDRVVNSILPQLNEQLELVLVDDGSTDSSGSICDIYAEKYDNIQTVHKTNGGLSSARNAGIAAAKGDYLSFVDVDDYLEPNAYSKLIKIVEEYAPDCIDFGWKYINQFGEITPNHHGLKKDVILGSADIKNSILPPLLNLEANDEHFIFDYVWNKIYKLEIIRKHGVQFDESRRTWEDRPFLVQYLKHCNTFYSVDQYFYNYVYVPRSLSQHYDDSLFRIIIDNYQQYVNLFGSQYDFNTPHVNNYWCRAIEKMIFTSLYQTADIQKTRQIILDVLSNVQVLHWFAQREPTSTFDEKVANLILSGQKQAALKCYERAYRTDRFHNSFMNAIRKLKGFAHSLLRGN